MSEKYPLNYEQTGATRLEDGAELVLHASKLVSPEQGRALADAARLAEAADNTPERIMAGHEQIAVVGRHVMAVRQAELNGIEDLSDASHYDLAA